MKPVLLLILALVAFNACKKKSVEPEGVRIDIEMNRITAKPWLIYKVEMNGSNIWNLGLIENCLKDDTYKFYKDSVLMVYDNTNKCSGGTDSTDSEWSFFEGRKKIIGSILGISDTADILRLEETEMELNIDYEGTPLVVYFRNN